MSSSSRPRRKAAVAANAGLRSTAPVDDPDADPEFLALFPKQRRAIDRAFERGLRLVGGRSRKRRKLNGDKGKGKATWRIDNVNDDGGGGGFVDDGGGGGFVEDVEMGGGGFIDDDLSGGEGGGFIDDDDDDAGGFIAGEPDEGGGFIDEDNNTPVAPSGSTSRPSSPTSVDKIPLHVLPGLLGSLGLPSDDDVLEVFKASASGWEETDTKRRKRGEDESLGVERKDFRAVCAALMGPDDGGEGVMQDDEEEDEQEEEDAFELSDGDQSDSSLSSLSSASSFGGKGRGKGRQSTSRKSKVKDLQVDSGPTRLSSRQKEMVADIWRMVKPDTGDSRGNRILGRDEVRKLVRDLGEMWTDEEITEMVNLFSTQHEGRGLSYDDFGVVMLRAGLV